MALTNILIGLRRAELAHPQRAGLPNTRGLREPTQLKPHAPASPRCPSIRVKTKELVRKFALDLTERFGRGFGFSQVKMMRQFYQTFPDAHAAKPLILQTTVEKSGISQSLIGRSENPESSLAPIGQSVIGQFSERSSVKLTRALERLGQIARTFPLPWTHYVRLLRVRNSHAREFYAREALAGGWVVRQLNRQINSQFYERTALSKDKTSMLVKGEKPKPSDAVSADEEIRNPLVLEFLNLKDEYSESDLEEIGRAHV